MVLLTRSNDKRVECRINVDMGRFTSGTHQQGHQKLSLSFFTKKLKTCVGAGDGHIKHKFLKHYQVFFYKIISNFI